MTIHRLVLSNDQVQLLAVLDLSKTNITVTFEIF